MKVTPTPGSVSGRRIDRVGDPLEGLVNLFDLSLVLAVGLLLAALSSAGVVGLVSGPSGNGGTPVPEQPSGDGSTQGQGQEVGKVYRLSDGSYVFAPSGAPSAGATGSAGSTGATGSSTPSPPPSPSTGSSPGTSTPNQGGSGGSTTIQPNPPSGGF